MQSSLKKVRVILALVYFTLLALVLLDFRDFFTPAFVRYSTYLQFVPSLIKIMHVFSVATAGVLVVILLTLLFGRIYCSVICPLGIFQDMVIRITRLFKKKKITFSTPHTVLRYIMLAVFVVSILITAMFVIGLIDPFSIFSRFMVVAIKPVVIFFNNIFSPVSGTFLYMIDQHPMSFGVMSVTILITGVVVVMAVKHGRLYCNTICPVGTLLGLLSKISLFRIAISKGQCTHCSKCLTVCKAGCIDVQGEQIDLSRCVMCFNCINACSQQGIHIGLKQTTPSIQAEAKTTNLSRRKFIIAGSVAAGAGVLGAMHALGHSQHGQHEHQQDIHEGLVPVMPPGAASLEHFTRNCTACYTCVAKCPTRVIQPSFIDYGLEGLMQPKMDFKNSYCTYECTVCGQICPAGALIPLSLEEKKQTQIGIAKFEIHECVIFKNETDCGACAEHCPTSAVHMIPYKGELVMPEVRAEICIGCGACEFACPAHPRKAITVIAHAEHKQAELPRVEKLDKTAPEEFPF